MSIIVIVVTFINDATVTISTTAKDAAETRRQLEENRNVAHWQIIG